MYNSTLHDDLLLLHKRALGFQKSDFHNDISEQKGGVGFYGFTVFALCYSGML